MLTDVGPPSNVAFSGGSAVQVSIGVSALAEIAQEGPVIDGPFLVWRASRSACQASAAALCAGRASGWKVVAVLGDEPVLRAALS
jgi:hypothetical protein